MRNRGLLIALGVGCLAIVICGVIAAGNYRGDIDTCINSGGNCSTRVLHTAVSP